MTASSVSLGRLFGVEVPIQSLGSSRQATSRAVRRTQELGLAEPEG